MSPYSSINRLFQSAAAKNGGILKRKKAYINKTASYDYLLREVKEQGFSMIEVGDYYIIICTQDKLNIVVSS